MSKLFFTVKKLGRKQSLTPEGFLLCEEVPIARTGTMLYADGEILVTDDEQPVKPGRDGIIRAERLPEDVFRPETMASFEGKTVTDDHPPEDVTPANWKTFAVGHLQNIRRGDGIEDDYLLADMLIKEPGAIEAVRDGKREVSCGYDFEFIQTEPGRGRQTNIIGNHVALVEHGRCGPRCSIGDSKMAKKTWNQRALDALRTGDQEAAKELLKEAGADESGVVADPTGSNQHIHIHMPGGGEGGAAKDDEPEKKDDPLKTIADSIAGLCTRMDDFGGRLDALEKTGATDKAKDDEADKDDDKDKAKDEGDDPDKKDDKDKAADKARDSASLATEFQDAIARAEILAPGIELPKINKAHDAKTNRDALCQFRRRAIDKALTIDTSKAAITTLSGGSTPNTKAMTCDAVSVLFTGASELVKNRNNGIGTGSGSVRDHSTVKVPSLADINKRNREFFKSR